ncbi:class I SAM-dependent methyltransferase [Thermococcus argininiproducens]|uniref:Class I SAM-dependent methyltransferase n=1 Tax=Thermococcus argininiproducens TaxID=2866384 RepID=A0A9E7M9C6_9EURY|nr:class I SAM-dependent methyltransferase [Thermococcus argininiproducens]USG99533.1 class I SAM-dependent methyltransferase [Thermococcus argininiproducens]
MREVFKNLGYTDEPFYEKIRDEYDIESKRGRERFAELKDILSRYLPIKNGRALDIGCNAGLSSFVLEELGFEVVGIDIQEKAVERAKELAKKRGSKAEFYVMDAKNLDFKENTFDLVALLGYPLAHFSIWDFDKILQGVRRVLKPQGWIVIQESDFLWTLIRGFNQPGLEAEGLVRVNVDVNVYEGYLERLLVDFEKGVFSRDRFYIWSPWILHYVLEKNGFEVGFKEKDMILARMR